MTTFDTSTKMRNNPPSQPSSTGRQVTSPTRSASGSPAGISEDRIARRAYEIWERSGRPEGQSEQHWQQAEEELRRS